MSIKNKKVKHTILLILVIVFAISCEQDDIDIPVDCPTSVELENQVNRSFKMGFSSWSFGPEVSDKDETYQFILEHGDIYSEQVDDRIPWLAWMNNEPLPNDFVEDIEYRIQKKSPDHRLVLSVSLLNTGRTDIIEDWSGNPISYIRLNDIDIENAYFLHLKYLIEKFNPDYLVSAMESNELRINTTVDKWNEYKLLMGNIRMRLKTEYPNLLISESITLHNYYNPDINNPTDFILEISNYVEQSDFAAISFYPFFKGLHTREEFQRTFDFLHSNIDIPIAFVETTHLPEDLSIPSFNVDIESSECEQKEYLEVLANNAFNNDYEFIIWWAHKDYDKSWQTFPDDLKDIGRLWRDTGLIDESGTERTSFQLWEMLLDK